MKTEGIRTGGITERVLDLKETLFGAFGIMMVAILLANAIHYLFNIVMNRMLGTAAYGDLYSLLAIFLIATMGVMSIQTVITKYIADFEVEGETDKIRILVRSFSKWLLVTGGVIIIISAAVAWPLYRLLKLESPFFILILGASIAATFYLTLPFGILQGKQQFIGLGGANIANAVVRLLSAVVLVWLGLGVYGALGAGIVGAVVVSCVVVYLFRDILKGGAPEVQDFRPTETLRYLVPVFTAMFFIILLTQIDVVIVKALFSRDAAGHYSYAALAGKAVLFLPEGISLVMFPRVSELRAKGEPTRRVLVLSLLAVAVLVTAIAGFYAIFPGFTAYIFAGGKGKEVVNLVGLFGFAMALFAVVKLLAYYHLALERRGFILFFVAGGIAEVVGIMLFHNTLRQVVLVLIFVGAGLLVSNLLLAFKERE